MSNNRIFKLKSKLNQIIEDKEVSISQLAINSDISDACIRNWFSKRNYNPSLETLLKICDGLDIDICELFVNDEQEFYPINQELKELINFWNKLDKKQKEAVLIHIKSYK